MKLINLNYLSLYVQAHIEPLPISLNRAESETVKECDVINIKMRQYPAAADSENYELKIAMCDNGKP